MYVDGDAKPLWTYRFVYDNNGRLTHRYTGRPGAPDQWYSTYHYDAAGTLTEVRTPDIAQRDEYTYAGGILTHISTRDDYAIYRKRSYEYAEGRKIAENDDRDVNGVANRRVTYTYDVLGRIVREVDAPVRDPGSAWERDILATTTLTLTHTYDTVGNLVQTYRLGGRDTFDYSCWPTVPPPSRANGTP